MPLARKDIIDSFATLLCLVAVVAGTALVSAIVWRVWPFYQRLIRVDAGARPSDGSSRDEQLDGLRGILCLMVVVHHSLITLLLPGARGDWGRAFKAAGPYMRLNAAAVSMFFCVTAFLFYRRALANVAARRRVIELRAFFIQRIARIGPAVLLSGALIFAIDAFADARYSPANPEAFWPLFWRILSLGATGGGKDVYYNAGVMWTLGFEWGFYFLFPLLAWACAARVPTLIVILAWFGTVITTGGLGGMQGLMFTPGLLAASLRSEPGFRRLARSAVSSILAVVLFVAAVKVARLPDASVYLLAILLLLFPLIAAGCDVFGLLRLSSLRAIGVVSFSVYLSHGFVLYLARPLLAHVGPFSFWNTAAAIGAMIAVAVVTTIFSFISFRWIEHPGIELGRRLSHKRPT